MYGGEAFEGHNNYVNGGGTLVLVNEPHFNQNLASKSSIRSKQFKPNRWTITKGQVSLHSNAPDIQKLDRQNQKMEKKLLETKRQLE